jgi:hypothetical protein
MVNPKSDESHRPAFFKGFLKTAVTGEANPTSVAAFRNYDVKDEASRGQMHWL